MLFCHCAESKMLKAVREVTLHTRVKWQELCWLLISLIHHNSKLKYPQMTINRTDKQWHSHTMEYRAGIYKKRTTASCNNMGEFKTLKPNRKEYILKYYIVQSCRKGKSTKKEIRVLVSSWGTLLIVKVHTETF